MGQPRGAFALKRVSSTETDDLYTITLSRWNALEARGVVGPRRHTAVVGMIIFAATKQRSVGAVLTAARSRPGRNFSCSW